MSELLVFRLFGPLASWGEVAVGQVRPSAVRPTRSALLGLLAAALGITRGDDEGHAALAKSVRFAVRVDAPGTALLDYHTVNWRRPAKEVILTRRDELRTPRDQLNTVQSRRHYRCDAVATVAVEGHAPTRWPLATLRAALDRPVFPLSLGRKACPPALPLGPEIVSAGTLEDAYREYDRRRPLPEALRRSLTRIRQRAQAIEVAWDSDIEIDTGLSDEVLHLEQRRDEPLSRARWRFAVRQETVSHLIQSPHPDAGG